MDSAVTATPGEYTGTEAVSLGDMPARISETLSLRPDVKNVAVTVTGEPVPAISVRAEPVSRPVADPQAECVQLPNEMTVLSHRHHELNFLYREIIEEQAYLRHGIAIPPHGVVLDAGANIGLFSLFAITQAPNAHIFALEPARQIYDLLVRNTQDTNITCLPIGLGAANSNRTFTFYPNVSILSGLYAEPQRDRRLLEAVMAEQLHRLGVTAPEGLIASIDDGMLESEQYEVSVRSLAHVLNALRLKHIDLLKIDIEGGEYEALAAVTAETFARIGQIVVELEAEYTTETEKLLEAHGFSVGRYDASAGDGLDILYARRHGYKSAPPAPLTHTLAAQIEAIVRVASLIPCDVDVRLAEPGDDALVTPK